MLDHISIPVSSIALSSRFYDAVLATLGLERRKQYEGAIGYGPPSRPAPIFWILSANEDGIAQAGIGLHISFQAASRSDVDSFYETALDFGGKDAGKPGERPQYTQPFYGAFIIEPDGFKIEAVCRS